MPTKLTKPTLIQSITVQNRFLFLNTMQLSRSFVPCCRVILAAVLLLPLCPLSQSLQLLSSASRVFTVNPLCRVIVAIPSFVPHTSTAFSQSSPSSHRRSCSCGSLPPQLHISRSPPRAPPRVSDHYDPEHQRAHVAAPPPSPITP